jgi:hypothetical protein
MFMRFTGGGISHLSTQESTHIFEDEIQDLWGTVAVPALTDNSDDSDNNSDLDVQLVDAQQLTAADNGADSDPETELLNLEDATVLSHEDETPLDEEVDSEAWYTDEELEPESEEDVQADDGDCYNIEDESSLGYELP